MKSKNIFLISLHRNSLYAAYMKSTKNQLTMKKKSVKELSNLESNIKNFSLWSLVNTQYNQKIWNEIQTGDIVLFIHKKKIFSKFEVLNKQKDTEISKLFFKDISFSENRDLLIFLHNKFELDIDFNSFFSFDGKKEKIPTFFPIYQLSKSKIKFLIKVFLNLDEALKFLGTSKNDALSNQKRDKNTIANETKISFKDGKIKSRIGQSRFSKNVLKNFNYKCAACKLSDTVFLQAAHIMPIENEKISGKTNNGLCLCSNCHKLFDQGFFSFDQNFNIIKNKNLKLSDSYMKILSRKKISECEILPSKEFLSFHRLKFGII